MVDRSELSTTFLKLAEFAHRVNVEDLSPDVVEALDRTLSDSLGVAVAGVRTPELVALIDSWPSPPGASTIWGTGIKTDSQTATILMGTALCSLELDEGNKAARGHPGAHVIPAAFAEAQRLGASGLSLKSAVLAGYEVATRIASAFSPTSGLHPHGHWGAIGAAVAVGRLNGFSVHGLAEVMDVAAALPLATPFSVALEGSFVRNTWAGIAGSNGITAAHLVRAGLGSMDAAAAATFGTLLGDLALDLIDTEFGRNWTITQGYFKRHSACAYTHPPADAAIALKASHQEFTVSQIESIEVATHGLAAPLDRKDPGTRLAAMFSIPHVVAVALRDGEVRPEAFAVESLQDPEISRLREATSVTIDPGIDGQLPHGRGARVTVRLRGGKILQSEVPNAIGDTDHFPFGDREIRSKLTTLIGCESTTTIMEVVASLRDTDNVRDALVPLEKLCEPTEEYK